MLRAVEQMLCVGGDVGLDAGCVYTKDLAAARVLAPCYTLLKCCRYVYVMVSRVEKRNI
jgi:hypothetical protein